MNEIIQYGLFPSRVLNPVLCTAVLPAILPRGKMEIKQETSPPPVWQRKQSLETTVDGMRQFTTHTQNQEEETQG